MKANSSRFFIRMPRYMAHWLRAKYMPSSEKYVPIRLPWKANKAGLVVWQRAISNAAIRKLTPLCYSSQMFNMDPYDIPAGRLADFPTDDAMRKFTAIALPEPHYYGGVWIGNDDTMQLDQRDTQLFLEYVAEEFWNDFDSFWDDYRTQWRIDHPGLHCSYYDCLLDFMVAYEIDLDEEDAMYRAAKRRKKAIRENRTTTAGYVDVGKKTVDAFKAYAEQHGGMQSCHEFLIGFMQSMGVSILPESIYRFARTAAKKGTIQN